MLAAIFQASYNSSYDKIIGGVRGTAFFVDGKKPLLRIIFLILITSNQMTVFYIVNFGFY